MITIFNRETLSRALSSPIDARLKLLLMERRDQLGGDFTDIAKFLVMQPGDSLKALQQELGFDIFQDADGLAFPDPRFSGRWDWLADHGHVFEMCLEGTDAFTHVVLIQNSPMQNRLLRALCLTYAE